MQMKFYSPLTADFFPSEPDYEDEFYDEYEGYPQDGHELLEYETAIHDAVEMIPATLAATSCSIITRTIRFAAR